MRTVPRDEVVHDELIDLEYRLLLEGVYEHYGYDFRGYSEPSLHRRIQEAMRKEELCSVTELLSKVLHDERFMLRFIDHLAVNVTSMYRDPIFFRVFRNEIVPRLKTYPFVRLWVAGCSSGEEVYSLAILLYEEGIYDRVRLYATDISENIITQATDGIYSMESIKKYTKAYQQAGGQQDFSQYYTAEYGNAIIKRFIKKNIVFSRHNLAMDRSFNEFHVIFCRNVMIYFSETLTEQVLQIIDQSLCRGGVLGLGSKESLIHSSMRNRYKEIEPGVKLYTRVN